MRKTVNRGMLLILSISLFFLGAATASAAIDDSIPIKGTLANESPKVEETQKEKPPLKEQKTVIKKKMTYPKTGFTHSMNGTVIGLFLVGCSVVFFTDRMYESRKSKKSE